MWYILVMVFTTGWSSAAVNTRDLPERFDTLAACQEVLKTSVSGAASGEEAMSFAMLCLPVED